MGEHIVAGGDAPQPAVVDGYRQRSPGPHARRSEGWRAVAEPLLAELFTAQELAIVGRLKACRNPPCSIAFYDSSKNQSRVWHNTTTCGNLINVRAARLRRKAESASSGS